MKPELREDPTFLRYYEILRQNPASVVFAPLAEMLILYKSYEEAIVLCKKGLEKNPELVSGRLALSKAYLGVRNWKRASEEAHAILAQYPNHPDAAEIVGRASTETPVPRYQVPPVPGTEVRRETMEVEELLPSTLDPTEDSRWNTVTMAEILASQGNVSKARQVYYNILKREPNNPEAKEGLRKLS